MESSLSEWVDHVTPSLHHQHRTHHSQIYHATPALPLQADLAWPSTLYTMSSLIYDVNLSEVRRGQDAYQVFWLASFEFYGA